MVIAKPGLMAPNRKFKVMSGKFVSPPMLSDIPFLSVRRLPFTF